MIERLYVHNYRCFENFDLNLADHRSALVIGNNGSGKSTLREVLEIFQAICRGSGRARDLISGVDFSQHRKQLPMRLEVTVCLNGKRYEYSIAFEMTEDSREAQIAEEQLLVDGETIFSREQAVVTLHGEPEFRLDGHVVALPVINERPGATSVKELKAFFSRMILLAPVPSQMSGFSEEETIELRHDASNISSWLNSLLLHYPAAYGLLDEYLKSMIPDFSSLENVSRGEKGTQLVVKFADPDSDQTLSLDFKQLSDGEKCFFLSALVIAANKVSGPVFCMWDEPDNHLSLSEIGHFVMALRKMTNQGGQFIATSHHPETIRKFPDEHILVFSRKSHLEPSTVRRLTDRPRQGDLVESLIRGEIME